MFVLAGYGACAAPLATGAPGAPGAGTVTGVAPLASPARVSGSSLAQELKAAPAVLKPCTRQTWPSMSLPRCGGLTVIS